MMSQLEAQSLYPTVCVVLYERQAMPTVLLLGSSANAFISHQSLLPESLSQALSIG
jgi:hypothetical protein